MTLFFKLKLTATSPQSIIVKLLEPYYFEGVTRGLEEIEKPDLTYYTFNKREKTYTLKQNIKGDADPKYYEKKGEIAVLKNDEVIPEKFKYIKSRFYM